MAFGLGWFFVVRIASLGSVVEIDLSRSNRLNFSISSIKIVSINYFTRSRRAGFKFRIIGNISEECPHGGTDGNRISFNEPNNVFFTRGESE